MTEQKPEKQKTCSEPGCKRKLTKEHTTICEHCLETARASLFHRCGVAPIKWITKEEAREIYPPKEERGVKK